MRFVADINALKTTLRFAHTQPLYICGESFQRNLCAVATVVNDHPSNGMFEWKVAGTSTTNKKRESDRLVQEP